MAWVPGAFEIPTVASRLASAGRHAAILCLGAVIRGQTTHDQHINRAVSIALAQLGGQYKMPVIFGILTCETLEQAVARSGGHAATTGKDDAQAHLGNKGVDCAEAALEMVNLLISYPRHRGGRVGPDPHPRSGRTMATNSVLESVGQIWDRAGT